MKNLLLGTIFILFSFSVFSQKKPTVESASITTSSQCNDCKDRIENKLNYTKGIKFAELDLETKKLEVKFSTKKINVVQIKKIINELGYDADESKAKKEDVEKLPKCCQPGGMENTKN